jgi:organic radical activating enzyme
VIEPITFAIHLTYTCPLACAHCCFSSNPNVKDRLDPELVIRSIDALDANTIRLVGFTGGEPFLLGKHLVEFVRRAHNRGFATRVVTSGYFGTTPELAEKRLREVVDAGLNELSISWDDFHEAWVSFDTVRNVVQTAKKFEQLTVAIAIVQAANSKWTADRVRTELGAGLDNVVCESPLNLTGRAERELQKAGLRSERALGPCPYILTGPTLSAKGKLLACCGVIPDTDRLCIEPNYAPEHLGKALERAKQSVLFNWLYLRGPYAIMEWMSERYGIVVPPRDTVGGNCQACKHLFEDSAIEAVLDQALLEKGPEVFGEYQLLKSLGAADPRSVLSLWLGYVPLPHKPNAPLPGWNVAALLEEASISEPLKEVGMADHDTA